MKNLQHLRAGALAIFAWAFIAAAPVRAEITNAVLQLLPATATENSFDITVDVLGSQDTETVIYSGVLRPVLDIDFTNLAAPVLQTLDFAGQDGDVQHTNATFSVPLGTAVFENVTGRVRTAPGHSPAPVVGGTTFNSSDHQLILWHGTIDVTPIIGSPQTIDLFDDTFTGTFQGTGNSTVSVSLNQTAGNIATYDVAATAVMNNVQMTTGDPQIDGLISIFITGNFVASGQFTRPIPEPAAGALAALLAPAALLMRRARGRK
jgi:hypothetical protein